MERIEKLALEWVKLNYTYNKLFAPKEVDCVVSKLFNTIDFYFVENNDEEEYLNWKKDEYKEYCKENYNHLIEIEKIDKEKFKNWKELFEYRTLYPSFISELFVNSKMVEQMLAGKNLKRIKNG